MTDNNSYDFSKEWDASGNWVVAEEDSGPSKAELYDALIEARRVSMEKYHKSIKGKEATAKASKRYYEKHREKILAKKKASYEQMKKLRAEL